MRSNNSNMHIIKFDPVVIKEIILQELLRVNMQAFLVCCHYTFLFITSTVVDIKFLESVGYSQLTNN